MSKLEFGELEFSIMKVLKEKGTASIKDVHIALGSTRSYTTIMTVMSRLEQKGDLLREKQKRQYIYSINKDSTSNSKNILDRLLDKLFGGKKVAMVSYLLDLEEKISEMELTEIENLILKKKMEKTDD